MMLEVSVTSSLSTDAASGAKAGTRATSKAAAAPPVLGTYGRVAAWLSKRVEVALAQVELTLPQYRVLGILAEGSAAASGLADRLAVRRPSITALIDGLVTRGLVDRRQEDSDRRRVELRLTPEGAQHAGPGRRGRRRVPGRHRRTPPRQGRGDGPALVGAVGPGHGRVATEPAPPRGRCPDHRQPAGTTAEQAMSTTEDRVEGAAAETPTADHGRRAPGAADTQETERGTDPRRLPLAAYVPMGVTSRYEAPKATVDPDRSKGWIKRARPIVMAHKVQFFSALIFSFLGLIIQVWIPKILQNGITNSLINRTQPLHNYVELLAVLALFTGIFGYISRNNLFKVAYSLEFDLRNILYEHFTRMSFPFYDRVQSGQLISRANSDIRSVQMYLTFAPMILVQCSIALVAFGFMLSISVPLAFVAMAAMPFIYIVGVKMRASLFPVSWLIQSRLAEVATVVDENVNGVRVVRSFAAEQQQLRQLATAADRVQWSYIKDADLRARFAPLVQNLSQVGLVLVLLVGGWMVIHENLPVASIVSFNLYLIMMQAPFMMLGMLIMMGQRASASAERIYEILDEQPTIVDRPGAVDLVDCKGDVEFDDVTFAYAADSLLSKPDEDDDGRRDILRNLNLHLHPGETVALVGRTGSGKSSVARVLARFYDATGGTVRVDGHDVRDLTLTSLRGNIGVVLDEPFLFSVSIRDNIAYGRPDATMEEVVAAAEAAGAAGFINRLSEKYDTVVGERGYTLSGGQRQRIAIARALLVNPPILILDDATSAIDVKVEQRIHSALRVLMEGRTTLIIAHRLSTISLADRVVLLDSGRIVADGTHAELLASTPLYAEVLAQAASDEDAAEEAAAGAEDLGLDGLVLEPDAVAHEPEDTLVASDDDVLESEWGKT